MNSPAVFEAGVVRPLVVLGQIN